MARRPRREDRPLPMSIGLNALKRHGSPKKPRASRHRWTPAGSTISPEEVLRNTVLEFGIQRGEPNRRQVLLTAREHSDMEPSLHLYGALIKSASAWMRLSKCRDLKKELIEVGRDRGLRLLLPAKTAPEQATEEEAHEL